MEGAEEEEGDGCGADTVSYTNGHTYRITIIHNSYCIGTSMIRLSQRCVVESLDKFFQSMK